MTGQGNARRSTNGCPEILEEVGKSRCGFDFSKEIATKEGLFYSPDVKPDANGGVTYRNENTSFRSLWLRAGGSAKVAFDPMGTFDLPEQFLSEFEAAMRDEGLFFDGADVVRNELIHLYPDPESSAGGATVQFLDDTVRNVENRESWDQTRAHPESAVWEKFTRALVFKSNCVAQQITIDKSKAEEYFQKARYVIKEYAWLCGVELEARLIAQMQATNVAMRMVFEQISRLGRCLYPCADCPGETRRKYSKDCGKLILSPLTLADDGHLGLLSLAISFATAYGKVADDIVDPRHATYKDIVAKEFGCTYKSGLELKLGETIRQLQKRRSRANRHLTCRTVIAHHRAFEMTFLRFVAAVRAWMQSFARDLRAGWLNYPCRRLFRDPFVAHEDFCQAEAFKESNGDPIDETNSCAGAVVPTLDAVP